MRANPQALFESAGRGAESEFISKVTEGFLALSRAVKRRSGTDPAPLS